MRCCADTSLLAPGGEKRLTQRPHGSSEQHHILDQELTDRRQRREAARGRVPTPGVLNRKLKVLMNSNVAMALPTADNRGNHGLRATSNAAMISTVPSIAESSCTLNRASSQLVNGLCLMYCWMRVASGR